MGSFAGSACVVSIQDDYGQYLPVMGLRTRQLQLNSELVDITTSDSAANWREALDGCGNLTASVSGDGIFVASARDEVIRAAEKDQTTVPLKFFVPGFGEFTGSFRVASLQYAAEYNQAGTYSVTFESAGDVTFTASTYAGGDSSARATPSAIPEPIVSPISVRGAGLDAVLVSGSVVDVALEVNSARIVAGEVYVNDSTGNDGNPGTLASPFKTLAQALRTSNAGTVYVAAGTYEPSDVRLTDTPQTQVSGGILKRMIATGAVVITHKYDTISALTWTKTGGYTNVYEAQLTAIAASPAAVHHVLDTSDVDAYGFATGLYKYSDLATLDAGASGNGWYYDTSTKKLYVALGGTDAETYKANLEALYLGSAGTARMLILGGRLIMECQTGASITLKGVNPYLLLSGTTRPELYMRGVAINWANDHGVLVQGGLAYSQDCTVHAPKNDGFNYSKSSTYQGFGQEINCHVTAAGDEPTFGTSLGDNRNGSSCHGGADIVRLGGLYEGSSGPDIVDTSASGEDNASWMVGVYAKDSSAENSVSRIGIGIYGGDISGGDRTVWIDSCKTSGETTGLLNSDGATVYTHRGDYDSTNGTFVNYNPGNPG